MTFDLSMYHCLGPWNSAVSVTGTFRQTLQISWIPLCGLRTGHLGFSVWSVCITNTTVLECMRRPGGEELPFITIHYKVVIKGRLSPLGAAEQPYVGSCWPKMHRAMTIRILGYMRRSKTSTATSKHLSVGNSTSFTDLVSMFVSCYGNRKRVEETKRFLGV